MPGFKLGERVARKLYMDDGTWVRLGDDCLDRSPFRQGIVTGVGNRNGEDEIDVEWDPSPADLILSNHGRYLRHGLRLVPPESRFPRSNP